MTTDQDLIGFDLFGLLLGPLDSLHHMGLLSPPIISLVGLSSKALLNTGFCHSVTVNGLPILLDALANDARNAGQGVITVSNHISTLDDPVTWGVLPPRCYLTSRGTRWALGASDIMFTNPIFSTFFRLGQTLETFRGKGIYQPAVDTAIKKLDQGAWVHLYGEGKVNQPNTYPQDDNGDVRLPRFKWGVGRIVMESAVPPVIIPMWLTGFDTLMPEGRSFPYKYLPRPGARLSVTFGNPLPPSEILQALEVLRRSDRSLSPPTNTEKSAGWIRDAITHQIPESLDGNEARKLKDTEVTKVRTEITSIIHRGVEALGRSVSRTLRS